MIKKETLAARYPARPEPTGGRRFSEGVAAAEGPGACVLLFLKVVPQYGPGSSRRTFCRVALLRFGNSIRVAWISFFLNCFEWGRPFFLRNGRYQDFLSCFLCIDVVFKSFEN